MCTGLVVLVVRALVVWLFRSAHLARNHALGRLFRWLGRAVNCLIQMAIQLLIFARKPHRKSGAVRHGTAVMAPVVVPMVMVAIAVMPLAVVTVASNLVVVTVAKNLEVQIGHATNQRPALAVMAMRAVQSANGMTAIGRR